jgi:hypothetical protein
MPKQDQSDSGGNLITAIGGTAIAVGNNTSATISIENTAHGNGHASIAKGDAIVQAEATSADTGPIADATTFLFVSNADRIVVHERSIDTLDGSDATALSILRYVAIDNPGNSSHGPMVVHVQQSDNDHLSGTGAGPGNVAAVSAAADAHGDHTAVATSATAITVENQFSFVDATALVAV